MANPQICSCPECGQVDMVQKVSALVEGGTTAGIYSNTAGIQVARVSSSAKASQLAPPRQPILESSWGNLSLILVAVSVIGGSVFLLTLLVVLVEGNGIDKVTNGAFFLALTAVCFGITALIFREKQKTASARKAQYEIDKSQWERALVRWGQLYYCTRNDIVSLPGKAGACASASQISVLLYKS